MSPRRRGGRAVHDLSSHDDRGPLWPPVEDRLLACEYFVGRLRRLYDGEIAPDRHYFEEKARYLRDAAQALVERVENLEWWMATCSDSLYQASDGLAGVLPPDAGVTDVEALAYRLWLQQGRLDKAVSDFDALTQPGEGQDQ